MRPTTFITADTSRADVLNFIQGLDPLVGDTACQLYSTHLLMLFLKSQDNQRLLPEEIEFLNACKILTITAIDQPDISGCTISRRVNPELLSGEISSKTQREKKVREARKYVATFTFDSLAIFFLPGRKFSIFLNCSSVNSCRRCILRAPFP